MWRRAERVTDDVRVGLVGVNTSHAGAFARILNEHKAIPGARLNWVWGGELRADQPDASTLAQKYGIDAVAGEPTELLGQTDLVLVVDDTGGGTTHVPLARPFVDAGIATFIDKPMTPDLGEAQALFALAETRNVPVFSASALRFAAELEASRDAFRALGELSSVVSVGPGEWFYYGVHAVEQLFTVAGGDVEWVQRFSFADRDVAVLSYANGGPTAVVQTLRDAAYAFHVTAYGKEGLHAAQVKDSTAYYTNLVRAAVEMARTRVAPIAAAETLNLLAVLQAGVTSADRGGERVTVADLVP
jgi:predicted dehydrogenase